MSVSQAARTWRNNRRLSWIEEHGPCQECGSTENLEVDHINPEDKYIKISNIWTYREELRNAELIKCQVLCEDCHRKKTTRERSKFVHGTLTMYTHHRCRCDECKKANSDYYRNR